MAVQVQLLECLASPNGTWQAGDFFPAVDQVEADHMVAKGLAIHIPKDVEVIEDPKPKAKKSKKGE
jgi:hypothetical protein